MSLFHDLWAKQFSPCQVIHNYDTICYYYTPLQRDVTGHPDVSVGSLLSYQSGQLSAYLSFSFGVIKSC